METAEQKKKQSQSRYTLHRRISKDGYLRITDIEKIHYRYSCLMKINTKTVQILQIELGKKFDTREEKLAFLSRFVGYELQTSKDLTQYQAMDVIRFLKTGKQPDNTRWAYFDKHNAQHRNILSQCITYGWQEVKNGKLVANLNNLGGWLKSFRSPVQKPLLKRNPKERTTIINALKSMIQRKDTQAKKEKETIQAPNTVTKHIGGACTVEERMDYCPNGGTKWKDRTK